MFTHVCTDRTPSPLIDTTLELTTALVPVPTASVLQQLRTATAAQHRTLEARLPLTHADLDLATYQRIIQAYYGFHSPLQRLIDQFFAAQPAHLSLVQDPARHKVPALLKDLHALGLSDVQIKGLPQCSELPVIDSVAQLLGVMYVMEGATLGGQVLRRIIAGRLGIDAESGGEFLDVYGRGTGRLWKTFLKQLADFDSPRPNAEVVHSACITFECFQTWLERARVLNDA
jgi:heme oxygenase